MFVVVWKTCFYNENHNQRGQLGYFIKVQTLECGHCHVTEVNQRQEGWRKNTKFIQTLLYIISIAAEINTYISVTIGSLEAKKGHCVKGLRISSIYHSPRYYERSQFGISTLQKCPLNVTKKRKTYVRRGLIIKAY